jgi:hypothetical protein
MISAESHSRQNCGFGKVEAFRIAPRAANRPVEKELRDIDQHQAGQDLVGVEPRFQKCRDRRIGMPPPITRRPASAAASAGRFPTGNTTGKTDPAIAPMMNWPSAPMFQLLEQVTDRQADSDQDQRRRLDQPARGATRPRSAAR